MSDLQTAMDELWMKERLKQGPRVVSLYSYSCSYVRRRSSGELLFSTRTQNGPHSQVFTGPRFRSWSD